MMAAYVLEATSHPSSLTKSTYHAQAFQKSTVLQNIKILMYCMYSMEMVRRSVTPGE